MSKKTIYIAGLGLIGGSLALGIKRDHPDYEILGYNRSDYSRNIALERGIVDRATSDFKEFAPLADVIILAVPIKQTVAYLKELADLELKDDVIITDAGQDGTHLIHRHTGGQQRLVSITQDDFRNLDRLFGHGCHLFLSSQFMETRTSPELTVSPLLTLTEATVPS